MTERKILVPIDFSAQSRAALGYATAFAKDCDAELLIVHVMHPDTIRLEGVDPVAAVEGLDSTLHQVKPPDPKIRCSYRLLEGLPAEAILDVAQSEAVEMIVMGTHGRSGLMRLVMGSVAEEVVRKAECPVLTLRQPVATAEATEQKSVN